MIQDQLKKGKTPTSLLALQQIADFMTTSMPSMYPAAPQGGMAALNMSKQMNRVIVGRTLSSARCLQAKPHFSIWGFELTCCDLFSGQPGYHSDAYYRLWTFSTFLCVSSLRLGYGDSSQRPPWLRLDFL